MSREMRNRASSWLVVDARCPVLQCTMFCEVYSCCAYLWWSCGDDVRGGLWRKENAASLRGAGRLGYFWGLEAAGSGRGVLVGV